MMPKPSTFILHSAGKAPNRAAVTNSIVAGTNIIGKTGVRMVRPRFERLKAGMILSSTRSSLGKPGAGVARRRLSFAFSLLGCLMMAGVAHAYAVPSSIEDGSARLGVGAISASTRLAQAQTAPAPAPAPARPPSSTAPAPAQAASDEPIGNVATLTGTATVTRNKASTPLKLQDDIFLNDILQTSANSTLGVTFNDATTFNLTANARITVDNYIYEEGGKKNSALFDIANGTVAFVAAAVAKSGDMKVSTPTATLGIRGTTGLVEVPQGGSSTGANNIKLYPDADGKVGHIDISDRSGVRLGSLTQGASGFTVQRGAGGRVTAAPLVISPQQAARDQGIVRQVHAAQVVGRQVVSRQRALRQANPNRTNPRSNQQQRPGSPNKPGQPQQHDLQKQPNAPGTHQPGLQNKPPKKPPPPRGKPPKRR
jgi:FecR protein